MRLRRPKHRDDFKVERSTVRGDVLKAVLDPMWFGLATPYEPDLRLDALTPGQRALYALHWTRSEVSNGGFEQCFANSTGYLLPEAREGARTFGSAAWAAVLDEAAAVLGEPYPRDRDERGDRLAALPDEAYDLLEDLDRRLWALDDDDTTQLDRLALAYLEAHPEDFFA